MNKITWIFLFTFFSLSAIAETWTPPLFKAKYAISAMGLTVAEGTRNITKQPDGSYLFHTLAKPTGIVGIFREDTIEENSQFLFENQQLKPLLYEYKHLDNNRNPKKYKKVVFNWAENTAQSIENKKQWALSLQPSTVDFLLSQIALMQSLGIGKRGDQNYFIADEDEIKAYTIQFEKEEILETPLGKLKALKFIRRAKNPQRYSSLWCAVDLKFLPIRIEHTEPNDQTVTAEIKSLDWQ
ncbi:MAG: hypothetical protein RIT27_1842 [Pseudomonadota bacterium]|jgi:hypothetical protein